MYNHKKRQNPQIQIGAMKKHFPDFKHYKKGNNVVFIGNLFVAPEIPIYTVSIECSVDNPPAVKEKKPVLHKNAPHTFTDNSLCLYHWSNFKWDNRKLITNEIIHWTIAWIYFYEYWLQTGEWIAPEVPHTSSKRASN
ncbi:MAG: hypothetical protein MdMp024_0114 [Bacteroidales bacterium]